MVSPETKKLLEELNRNQYGKALREYLDDKMFEIRDVTKYKTWKEAEGGQIAVKLIRDLFYFMEEKKQTPNTRNQYY